MDERGSDDALKHGRASTFPSFHSLAHHLACALPPSLPSFLTLSLPLIKRSTGFLGKYLQFEMGKVGYRLYLANRGDEQDVRPFKVAFDLGQVGRERGREEGTEGRKTRVLKRMYRTPICGRSKMGDDGRSPYGWLTHHYPWSHSIERSRT